MILNSFKDRRIERPNTFKVQENNDGTITLIPVTGSISEYGTPLNANTLNSLILAINEKLEKGSELHMSNMGQDVKLAMTGGSVPVVGVNAVGEENVKTNGIIQRHVQNNQIGRLKQVGSIAEILTKDSIEINIQEGLLKIKNAPYIFTDTTSTKFGTDNTTFSIDKVSVLSKTYVLYADLATLTIEFAPLNTIVNPYMILCYMYFTGNINNVSVSYCGNSKSVKVFDNQGKEIVETEFASCDEGFIYPASGKQLDISKVAGSTTDIKITVTKGAYLLATNYAINFTVQTEQTITLTKNNYLSKIYYNFNTSKFEAYNFTVKILPKPYLAFVGWFILRDSDGDYWGINYKNIYLNGKNGSSEPVTPCNPFLPFSGKIYNALGDSITYGLKGSGRLDNPYPALLKDLCNFSVANNYGISSSTIATNTKVSNWNEVRNPMVLRYSSMDGNAEVISIFGGINDFIVNVPIGTMDSRDTDTFYGALHVLYSGLIKKYPTKCIFVITPIRCSTVQEVKRTVDNITLKQWCEVIKEVASYYSLPVLDLQKSIGINPDITEQVALIPDGLHPSQEGANILARKIGKFINFIV